MALVKYARAEILESRSLPHRPKQASLEKFSDYDDFRTDDGFIYTRVRAISSRVNKNHDAWSSDELAKSYKTFLGKPVFVDHHNSDPGRARGVVVDAKLHVDDEKTASLDPYYSNNPDPGHLPPTWIELLLETDARAFPKLAKAIADGDIDAVSMGANVERSECSHCGNIARSPEDYCMHIRTKGAEYDYIDPETGHKTSKASYERCMDIGFFEISYVFDPADETALFMERIGAIIKEGSVKPQWDEGLEAVLAADEQHLADTRELPQSEMTIAPEKVDTLRQETICPVCGSEMEDGVCAVCNFEEPPEGFGNPDLTKAEDLDDKQEAQGMEAEDAQQQSMQQTDAQGAQGGEPGQPGPTPAGMPMAASFTTTGSNTFQTYNTTSTGTTTVTYIPRPGGDVSIEKTAADLQGGRVNTQEKPILPVSRQNSDRPKEQKTISDSRKPVESNNSKEHHHMTDTKKTADGARPNGGADVQPATRVDPDGKGGIGLDPEDGIKTVDVLGVGGVDTVSFDSIELDAPVADAIGPHTDTWNGNEGDSAGQQKAVTENEPVLGAKTVKGWPDGLGTDGFETVDLDSPLAEEIGDPTKTFGGDSFHITDPVTNEKFEGDEGVKDEASAGPDRSPFPAEEEGVKDAGGSGPDHSGFPGSDEAVKAARVQWTAALKVAETEVAMGITSPEEKLNRLADLEDEGISALNTRLETLSRVKTAAAKRTARTATTKTGGVPSLKPESAFARREASNNDSQVDIAESIFA